jgi:putative transposase
LVRAQRGGQNRQKALLAVQRQQVHVANQRKDYLEKLTTELIRHNDFIAVEDLTIPNMVRNHHLSKSILDSGWGYFVKRLTDKAAEAGRLVIQVAPHFTSKTCSNCGAIFEELKLADRWVTCGCGLSLDRDENAAINILNKALGSDGTLKHNVGGCVERVSEATPLEW